MRPALALALVCQLALSLGYLLYTPAFEGPDENDHAYYASQLAHRRALPTVLRSGHSAWDYASLGHHPPLYYALLAATMHAVGAADTVPSWCDAPAPGVLHWQHGYDEVPPVSAEMRLLWLLRGWSVLCGLASVWLTHRLARLVFPAQPAVADAASLLLACLPQWSFMHGVLDNGNLATALSLAVLVGLASVLAAARLAPGRAAWLGALVGLALVTKLTSLFLVALLAAVVAWVWWRAPARRRETAAAGALALTAAAALAGWFFWRNYQLYGDVLAADAHRAAYAVNRVPPEMLWDYLTGRFAPELYASFVGNFGWVSWRLPGALLAPSLGVLLLGLLGWVAGRRRLAPARAPLACTAAAAALVAAQVVKFNLDFFQPQGRYLFPAAGPMLILLAGGLVALAPRALRRAPLAWCLAAVPPLVGAGVLLLHFAPAFQVDPTGVDRHRAAMVAGLASPPPPPRATLALVEPADGARLRGPPTFRWQPLPDAPQARYTLHVFTPAGRVLFGTYETGGLAFAGGEFALPEQYWLAMPAGEPLLWKVRRLPDRSRGEGVDDVPESAPRALWRIQAPGGG